MLNTFYYTAEKASLSELMNSKVADIQFIPDVSVWSKNNKIKARLIAVSAKRQPVFFEKFELFSDQTDAPISRNLDLTSSPRLRDKLWFDSIDLLPYTSLPTLSDSPTISLVIYWRETGSDQQRRSIFKLKRVSKWSVAWVT